MRRQTRRLLFFGFTLIFLIAGPILIAYSFGYTLNLSTVTLSSTGGVFVKSATPRLAVFLDGAFLKETGFITGSTLLTDVLPGTHHLRLEKPEFRPWSKTILVEPTAVTELRNVLLIPRIIPIATSTASERNLLQAAAEHSLQATTTASQTFALDKEGNLAPARGLDKTVVAENVHSFAAVGNTLFFVGQSGFLARYDTTTRETATIGRPGFFLDSRPVRFIPGSETLVIIDSSGGLFLYDNSNASVSPASAGVKDVAFDSQEKKLLILKNQEIDVIWLKDNPHQPFQKKGTLEPAVSATTPIHEAHWYYATDAHIAYNTRQGVFLAEIDRRGGANSFELLPGITDEILTSASLPSAVFYKKGKTLYKIEF